MFEVRAELNGHTTCPWSYWTVPQSCDQKLGAWQPTYHSRSTATPPICLSPIYTFLTPCTLQPLLPFTIFLLPLLMGLPHVTHCGFMASCSQQLSCEGSGNVYLVSRSKNQLSKVRWTVCQSAGWKVFSSAGQQERTSWGDWGFLGWQLYTKLLSESLAHC